MRILVTGLTTMHWGRMEYGNIGNYYIIGPLFRSLHKLFPDAVIDTTMQLSDGFCSDEDINMLPIECYYAWRENGEDLKEAEAEYTLAQAYAAGDVSEGFTPYMNEVKKCDLIIDFNGDMWGDNSVGMGESRFRVELLKIRTAQLLGVKTVMFASSPGPVTDPADIDFAKEVYKNYDLVINRESFSKRILSDEGFDVSKTYDRACPSFLFGSGYYPEDVDVEGIAAAELKASCINVGFILATYSLPGGVFNSWERPDEDFDEYVTLIEHMINEKGVRVVLISHSNGFDLEPEFKRKHWRDHVMITKLHDILKKRGNISDPDMLWKVDNLYYPWQMHALIGRLDMLVSGRVHGAVAGLEQAVPTMAFDYKNGPLEHKMMGFFDLCGMREYVVKRDSYDFADTFDRLYDNRKEIREELSRNCEDVRKKVCDGFELIKQLMEKTKQ